MPLEKLSMRDDGTAERIVVQDEPDLHGCQREHDGCQRGARNRFDRGKGSPAHGLSDNPGFNEERNVNEGEGCGNNHHSPFEHESHAAHGKLQHARAPKLQTSHPPVGDQKQIDLKARSEKVLEGEGQRINAACDKQQLVKRENAGKLRQTEKRNGFARWTPGRMPQDAASNSQPQRPYFRENT